MKNLLLTLTLALSLFAVGLRADETAPAEETTQEESLDSALQKLATEENLPPPAVSPERLYAVQTRYTELKHRHEVSLGGAKNFTPDSYTVSNQIDLAYRFYLTNRWFLGLSGSYVFNDLNASGQRLFNDIGYLPDATFTKYRGDLAVGYNLFYGKFRLSMDQVFYFDQYVALGPGIVNFASGNQVAAVGDVGFVGWFGQHFTLRIGLKDYFVKEVRVKSSGMAHNLIGHMTVGYLF